MQEIQVLVIEDDPVIVKHMYKPLEKTQGINLDVATSEVEALERISRKIYDVAFVDIHLRDDGKDRGGINVIQEMHRLNEGTSIIVVSGTGEVAATVSAYRAGIVDFIQKKNLTNGAEVVKEVLERSIIRRQDFVPPYLGHHYSIASLLSEPDFLPIWENRMCMALGTSIEILHQSLNNALTNRLPILRLKAPAPSFSVLAGKRACEGFFWSKKLGAAIRVVLAFPDESALQSVGEGYGQPVYKKAYRNLNAMVWVLESGRDRDDFDELVWAREPNRRLEKGQKLPSV